MASKTGKCTNFGLCSIADSRENITLPEGEEFSCPECGKILAQVEGKRSVAGSTAAGGSGKAKFALAALAVLLVGGGLYYLRYDGDNNGAASTTSGQKTLFRLHGSNTIGAQLAPALAEAFLKQQGATGVRVVVGHSADESTVEGVLPGESSAKVIEIQAHGSATAFTDMAGKKCDLGMASRKVNRQEVAALSEFGDITAPGAENVIGLDGIAIIVNAANSIQSLTKDQVAKIFTGDTKSWSQVLSPRGEIHVYARDDKSGTFDTFKTLVLGGGALTADAKRIEDSRELSDKVAADADGIGFVGLPYIGSTKAVPVSDGNARPLLPTRLTVATEDYLLSRRLYLYAPSTSTNQVARSFVTFTLSRAGQEVVGAAGFVAQNVQREIGAAAIVEGPAGYKRLTSGADRLSLDFRFRPGSSILDNKALADLDRVITFVSDLKYTGQNVILIGFADSTGAVGVNEALSRERAKVVADQFPPRGLTPAFTGFGSTLPVASNTTEDGRQKNRRVEIWLKK